MRVFEGAVVPGAHEKGLTTQSVTAVCPGAAVVKPSGHCVHCDDAFRPTLPL
jgi:hypothetical protein